MGVTLDFRGYSELAVSNDEPESIGVDIAEQQAGGADVKNRAAHP